MDADVSLTNQSQTSRRQWLAQLAGGLAASSIVAGCAKVAPEPSDQEPKAPRGSAAKADQPIKTRQHDVPESLKARLELAIRHAFERDLAVSNAFWTSFHGVLAFGPRCQLVDRRNGGQVAALDYMLAGQFERGFIRGLRFLPTPHGLDVGMGPTFVGQGHQDQFVAILAQWDIPADRAVIVGGKRFTVIDFVKEIQAHVRLNQELSWSIIAIGWYMGTNSRWTNQFGEHLHYEALVEAELNATIDKAACGGTHRLYGLTWAYHMYRRNGGKMTPMWKRVEAHLEKYADLAKKYQSSDGSFSTNYFRALGTDQSPRERLNSSGHTLEWLSTSLNDEQLREPWVQRAVSAVSLMFLDIQSMPMESGALYHAAHGLVIYHSRVYGKGQLDHILGREPKAGEIIPPSAVPVPPPVDETKLSAK